MNRIEPVPGGSFALLVRNRLCISSALYPETTYSRLRPYDAWPH